LNEKEGKLFLPGESLRNPSNPEKCFIVLLFCRCRFWRRDPAQPDLKTKLFVASTTHRQPNHSAQNKI